MNSVQIIRGRTVSAIMVLAIMLIPFTSALAADKVMASKKIVIKKDKVMVQSNRKFMCINVFHKDKGKFVNVGQYCVRKQSVSGYSLDLSGGKPLLTINMGHCAGSGCSSDLVFEVDLLVYGKDNKVLVGDDVKALQIQIAEKMHNDIARILAR